MSERDVPEAIILNRTRDNLTPEAYGNFRVAMETLGIEIIPVHPDFISDIGIGPRLESSTPETFIRKDLYVQAALAKGFSLEAAGRSWHSMVRAVFLFESVEKKKKTRQSLVRYERALPEDFSHDTLRLIYLDDPEGIYPERSRKVDDPFIAISVESITEAVESGIIERLPGVQKKQVACIEEAVGVFVKPIGKPDQLE